jgi:hypothetical protein
MVVVRGTKKFLARVGEPGRETAVSTGGLGDWYANLWFWRPQVVLFVNSSTLLPVLVPLAPAKSVLSRLPHAFAEVAGELGVTGPNLEAELEAMSEQSLAKTESRSVLGTMNEFTHLADNYRWMHDDIELIDLSLWLAQVPCRPLFGGEGSPDRELRARLG